MTLSTLSAAQQIPQETKHSDIISRSTTNNSSQAHECNLSDVLLIVKVKNEGSSKQVELLIMELHVQNSQFREWFENILEDFASLQSGDFKFLEHSFLA